MSYFRFGDPLDDFDRLDREEAEWEARLPRCEKCKCKIDDKYFLIDDEILCRDCVEEKYMHNAEDYANAHE